jgi:hypothetical protein
MKSRSSLVYEFAKINGFVALKVARVGLGLTKEEASSAIRTLWRGGSLMIDGEYGRGFLYRPTDLPPPGQGIKQADFFGEIPKELVKAELLPIVRIYEV